MPVYYLDTSALFKRYRIEKGTEVLDELFAARQDSEVLTTSSFTVLEVISVLTRLLRARTITRRSHQRLLGMVAEDVSETVALQPLTDAVISEAINPVLRNALRAPDALQLATALTVQSLTPGEALYFLCTDSRLKSASQNSGMQVIDPEAADSLLLRTSRSGP